MNLQHTDLYAGEDRTLTLYARDASNVPLSLTGKTILWRVGRSPRSLDSSWPIFSKAGTVTDAANGVFTVAVAAADTEWLRGDYQHLAEATTTIGGAKVVVTAGRFRVRPTIEEN